MIFGLRTVVSPALDRGHARRGQDRVLESGPRQPAGARRLARRARALQPIAAAASGTRRVTGAIETPPCDAAAVR